MINKFIVGCALVTTLGCATFRHNSVPVTETIATHLEQISAAADAATSIRVMSSAQRQLFARDVMLPLIAANKSFAQCLLDGTCGSIPAQLKVLSTTLLKGITDFISAMPQVPATNVLVTKLNDALTYVNNLIGGKK